MKKLSQLKIGEISTIISIGTKSNLLIERGFFPKSKIEIMGKSPFGEITIVEIEGGNWALENELLEHIFIQ